ncbi:MAG: NADH:ubiquinone oxidoreductase subunit [Alphaproteobacteria bacterium]|jgi:NADH-quinone oxidoreductase subunit L|nr:NADH:ubiquinone oxidoreductase subunit [Alphaproteobacteria bacterium]
MSLLHIAEIAVFTPLIGFFVAGFGSMGVRVITLEKGEFGDRFAQVITCCLMGVCGVASCLLFHQIGLEHQEVSALSLSWIEVEEFSVHWGIKLDALSVTMMMIVSLVSFLVHVYSIGYMSHDHSIPRFMAYLSFFTFAMLALVTAPNLVQLFLGWEGVGLASYLLIGFWYEKPGANAAAMKAFIVNRVGDIGLALGICAIFFIFQTVDYDILFKALSVYAQNPFERPVFSYLGCQVDGLNLIGILVFIGAMGKSAQFGLHTWLPDAMEGPTPVSALIHAATMVTAGVFLVVRMSPLYELAPLARDMICVVGASTAFFAAMVAVTQNDIKRIIAYSTCSQLGYMFFAVGVSAYGAAVFHLVTHAFFKALLFLGAGAVIHAMSDEQDIRRMGGIRAMVPITYTMMWIGNLALAGIPFFAGYYSKDAILEAAYNQGTAISQFAFFIGLVVAVLTAFYSWRLLLLTFHGEPRADERVMAHVQEVPQSMKIPLYVLALGAIVSGYAGHDLFLSKEFWGKAIFSFALPSVHLGNASSGLVPYWVLFSPLFCAVLGITAAYSFYYKNQEIPNRLAARWKRFYLFWLNKGFVDECYDWLFVRRVLAVGRSLWKTGDRQVIDRFGPNGVTVASLGIARFMGRLQTGFVYHYAFAMLVGIVALTSWLLIVKEWL